MGPPRLNEHAVSLVQKPCIGNLCHAVKNICSSTKKGCGIWSGFLRNSSGGKLELSLVFSVLEDTKLVLAKADRHYCFHLDIGQGSPYAVEMRDQIWFVLCYRDEKKHLPPWLLHLASSCSTVSTEHCSHWQTDAH